ncbi:hypothetical protein GCM10023169_33730 [Georgenia halophila]|uniref:UvrABC system protein A n=1 Tax=Georgenia halophila TaxID=620889 RepID=A0ABP8LL53_9MICO
MPTSSPASPHTTDLEKPADGDHRHPADTHDTIEVRGARENNLADVSLDLHKRRLTVFTGVSGSGKSSLVFGTIAAESQRLINETYTAFVQSFMPAVSRPDVDHLGGLSAAIVLDQERLGANARSTVGTATDAYTMLRILFSRLGDPYIGPSTAFSFNTPGGPDHRRHPRGARPPATPSTTTASRGPRASSRAAACAPRARDSVGSRTSTSTSSSTGI